MENRVRWSIFGGVVITGLFIVCALLSVVLGNRPTSFLYGYAAAVLLSVFLPKEEAKDFYTSLLSSAFIIIGVSSVIAELHMVIWPWFHLVLRKFDLSLGWLVLGVILSVITRDLLADLYKRRKVRIARNSAKRASPSL